MHLKAVDCQLQMSPTLTLGLISSDFEYIYFTIKRKVWSGKYRCVPKKNKQAPNSTRMAIFVKKEGFKFRSNYFYDMLCSKISVL